MKKSRMNIIVQIKLVIIGSLMLVQPVLGGDLSEQTEPALKGKIFGDQLILIDKAGRQSVAKDGTYITQDGAKIIVKEGNIIDIPTLMKSSTFQIVEAEYFETE